MSLRIKFTLIFSGFAILLPLVLASVAAHQLVVTLERQFLERGKELAERVAKEAFLYTFVIGTDDLEVLVDSIMVDEVIYVQVVKGGQVISERQAVGVELPLPVRPCRAGFEVREGRLPQGTRYIDITRSLLGRPTSQVSQEEFSSYVRLGISLAAIATEIRKEYLIIGATGLAMVFLSSCLAFLFYQAILKPLGEIESSLREFGQGRLERRARVDKKDELGRLAQEFNRMADSIVRMRNELKRVSKAKSEFLTIMSHELRTPLHSLLGYSQLLLEGASGKLSLVQRRYLKAMARSGEHLLELLENALRFSKLEMGEERLHLEEVDCREVVEEALQACQASASEAVQKEIEVHVPKGPVRLVADRTKLRQILINLISNALKFASRNVEVHIKPFADAMLVVVKDDGKGISSEERSKIFEPFVQLVSAERRQDGLGLGLTIVQRYVELHGGRVWVKSEAGRGSEFCVLLPKTPEGRDEDHDRGGRPGRA